MNNTTVGELIRQLKLYPENMSFVLEQGGIITEKVNIKLTGTDGKYIHVIIKPKGKPKYDRPRENPARGAGAKERDDLQLLDYRNKAVYDVIDVIDEFLKDYEKGQLAPYKLAQQKAYELLESEE